MAAPPDKRGWPLEEAAWQFASASLRRYARNPPIDPQTSADPDDAFSKAFRPILDQMTARNLATNALRTSLLERLSDGRLVATGFPAHRDQAFEAVRVEPFMFQEKYVDWSRSRCQGQGRVYELVRVATQATAAIVESSVPSKPPAQQKKPVGRPNVRDPIVELTLELLDNPSGPKWTRRIELQAPVRELGIERYPDQFSETRPRAEVFRDGINKALEKRPEIKRAHKL